MRQTASNSDPTARGGERTGYAVLVRRKLMRILLAVAVLVLLLAVYILSISRCFSNQLHLASVLGDQRMLVETMAQDTNRKYALLQTLRSGAILTDRTSLTASLTAVNTHLDATVKEYRSLLKQLDEGKISVGSGLFGIRRVSPRLLTLLRQTDSASEPYCKAADVIRKSGGADRNTAAAIIYVNNHNGQLAGLYGNVSDELLTLEKRGAVFSTGLVLALFLLALLGLYLLLRKLDKYLVLPLDTLYRGINRIGNLKKGRSVTEPVALHDLEPVIEDIHQGVDKFNRLIELIENINKNTSFEEILQYIYTAFSPFIPYQHIGIALLRDNGETLEASFGISERELSGLSGEILGLRAGIRDTSLGALIWNGTPRIINDLAAYVRDNGRSNRYNAILLRYGVRASITLPLKVNDVPIGVIFFSSAQSNTYRQEHVEFLEALSDGIAISFNKNLYIDDLIFSSLVALAKLAEARDGETGGHLERMKAYSRAVADALRRDGVYPEILTPHFVREIERFSPMHDIGKVGVRDSILLKPGQLTPDEFDEMKSHTLYGGEVLRAADSNMGRYRRGLFLTGVEIAEGHHERWDGSGYPHGRAGLDIPLSARVVAVADVFDALTSKRPYKDAYDFDTSFGMILDGKETQFDPLIVETFARHRGEIRALYDRLQEAAAD